jgi:alanine racemase
VEISLDALKYNLLSFRSLLPKHIRIMAVVKADAYGHGAVQVARTASLCGVEDFAVATLDEALELREAGITARILVLGYTSPAGIAIAAQSGIALTVFAREGLEAIRAWLQEAGSAGGEGGAVLRIHIKLDTGMGRLGLHDEAEAIRLIDEALQLPGVEVEGLFTHYAKADEADKSYTNEQHRRFTRVVEQFQQRRIEFPYLHAGNSATAIDSPELTYNTVRLGIAMYGLYPSAEVNRQAIELKPMFSLKTSVVQVKTLPPGSGVSYGAIYRTAAEERIATLPIGYADGFTRRLTSSVQAIIRGHKVPVVGRICMDQCMINVSGVPDVEPGDEVVLIGRQGDAAITADDLADQLDTINYEIVCMISSRVPRIYRG